MKTEDIILIENNAGGEIHLVKDRLFWQAWERSAFLFVHNFKNYKVHHRFVQKVMQDFVWLGFPEKALGAILATAKSKNFVVKNISDSHIVISNIPNRGGFDACKENAINSNKIEKGVIPSPDNKSLSQKSDYLLFRLVYDFSVYVLNLVPKFNKIYKFFKRELKIKCYGRYVDDMVLVHSDKSVLVDAIDKVRSFLKDKLKLTLHPKKISLQPASYGFNFLGKYILPYRVYPGRRLRKNSLEALQNCHSLKEYQTKLESYKGLYKYVNGVPKVYREFFQNPKGGEDEKSTTV